LLSTLPGHEVIEKTKGQIEMRYFRQLQKKTKAESDARPVSVVLRAQIMREVIGVGFYIGGQNKKPGAGVDKISGENWWKTTRVG